MTEQEEPRSLTAGEQLLREIDTYTYWGIGRMGCHDIPAPSRIDPSPQPGEPFYRVKMNLETLLISITHYDGDGNEIVKDQTNE